MKKKTIILFAILLVILVGIACYMQYRYTHQSIKSFTATGCTAEGIIVKDSVSYLEVQFDDEKHTMKKIAVKDEEILKKISESNLQEIIGVNIASDIPKNVLEDDHLVSNMLLASYFVACEDGEEIIEALYEFAGNCKGFVAADEEMTHQVTKAEFETVLDECEDKCALRTCIEDSYALKTAETECYNMYREFALRFKENNINLILPRIDVNTDIRKYISEELGTILYGVLNTKLSKDT